MNKPLTEGMQRATQRYFDATPKSRALSERARRSLPDGVSRAAMPFQHYPIFVDRGEGQFIYDVDGRQVLDLSNGHSGLPLGHAHPDVIAAVRRQLDKGLGFALMEVNEVELAELLCERLPHVDRVRFTVTGGEATLYSIRLARAFMGRVRFARMEGSFHGLHDMMCTGKGLHLGSSWPDLPGDPVSLGVSPAVRDDVVFLPFNDLDGCERVMAEHGAQIAAIIVEPFQSTGGCIMPEPGFLAGLRALCDRYGALLIFDEMVSIGLAPGGAQEYYGVRADLFASGKLLGGSMPMGVFGGRADVMGLLEARRDQPFVYHSGTWNGHPLSMVAGIAQMRALTPEIYQQLGEMGEYVRTRLREIAQRRGVALQVIGAQHYIGLHYTTEPIRDYRTVPRGNMEFTRNVAFSLVSQGFYMTGARVNLSAPMVRADLDRFLGAIEIAFEEAGATTK